MAFLLISIGSFFFTQSARAESVDVIIERGLPEIIKGTQLVLETITEKANPERGELVLGSSSEADAQIAMLMALLQQLIATYNALLSGQGTPIDFDDVSSSVGDSCVALSRQMWLGSKDGDSDGQVSKLQKFLKSTGHYSYGEITGFYGPSTQMAVQSWQKSKGLIVSGSPETTGFGVVGPKTITAMGKGCGGAVINYTPGKLFTVSQDRDVTVRSGEQEVTVADIMYLPQQEDTYLNTIRIQAVPNALNPLAKPWETFEEIEFWSKEKYLGSALLNASKAWTQTKNAQGQLAYVAKVVDGNFKIPAQDSYPVLTTVSISDDAPIDETWTLSIPAKGVDVWTQTHGHRFFGPYQDFAQVTVVADEDDEQNESNPIMVFYNSDDASQSIDGITFELEFEVAALYDDMYVPLSVSSAIDYRVVNEKGATMSYGVATLASTADKEDNNYLINEGDEENFTLTVHFKPTTNGTYQLHLDAVAAKIAGGDSYTAYSVGEDISTDKISWTEETNEAPTLTVTASPSIIKSGASATVTWSSKNTTHCYMGDTISTSGSFSTGPLSVTKSYTIDCYGLNGDGIRETALVSVASGSPTLTISAKPTIIAPGESSTITWTATNAYYCSMGDKMDTKGSFSTDNLSVTKTYTITCPGAYGSVSKSVTVTVLDVSSVAPNSNKMSCSNPPIKSQANGSLACYGIWDYGESFGGDYHMCPGGYSSQSTGCVISTPACSSGYAEATKVYNVTKGEGLATIASMLKVTESVVKAGLLNVWEYSCTASTGTGVIDSGVQDNGAIQDDGWYGYGDGYDGGGD